MDIKGKILLVVVPNDKYYESMGRLMSVLTRKLNSVCYIALNKPHDFLIGYFEKAGAKTKKIFFIDAVSKKPSERTRVLLISSPQALLELNTGIDEVIVGSEADCFVFDSVSTLLLYGDPLVVTKFVHLISSKLRNSKSGGVFACMEKDISSSLISDLSMFTDDIIRL